MTPKTPFRLKKVCTDCPFRADKDFHGLQAERVSGIAQDLRDGATFHCHSTLNYSQGEDLGDDAEPLSPVVKSSQFCAGALATMEQGGEVNQIVRIGERLGLYNPEAFDWEGQPVFESLNAWEEALVERDREDKAVRQQGTARKPSTRT